MRMSCCIFVIKHGGYLMQDEFHSLKLMDSNRHMWDYTASACSCNKEAFHRQMSPLGLLPSLLIGF